MLITNFVVLAGVYVTKRLYDSIKPAASLPMPKSEPMMPDQAQKQEIAKEETDTENYKLSVTSAASVALTGAGQLLYPPLSLVGFGVASYAAIPIVERFVIDLNRHKKFGNNGYSAITSLLLIGTGNLIAIAIHNTIYHVSGYLVERTRRHSRTQLTDLYQATPETVWLDAGDGAEQSVPLEAVGKGDRFVVSMGSNIPLDGQILSGSALIDQQALTGEASPVERLEGDSVMAGTLVLSGKLVVEAAHGGSETRIAELNKLLTDTIDHKSTLQLRGEAWANRASLPWVLFSIGTAPLIGIQPSMALLFSLPPNTIRSMLSLTTFASMKEISQEKVLVKDGRVLEELLYVDTVLFDKTGTLTLDKMEVAQVIPLDAYHSNTVISTAAAVEQRLEHPIAKAIVNKAKELGLKLPKVARSQYEMGLGIGANVEDNRVHVGSIRYIRQVTGVGELPAPIAEAIAKAEGHTFVMVAINGKIAGAMELTPILRPGIADMVRQLREMGISQIAIVSGDLKDPTEKLAAKLSMDAGYGEVLPQDKAALIRDLQAQGKKVCFVGDGLNDAIAMKQANVSVSLQTASALTSEVAQVILLDNDLTKLPRMIKTVVRLDAKLRRRLSLWIGFGAANTLAVPLLGFTALQSSLAFAAANVLGIYGSSQVSLPSSHTRAEGS